jgi:hypothetical protein
MPTPIVTVQVTQQIAPTPNTLQKTGAFISQGGTTLTPGTATLLQQYSDLSPNLGAPISISNAVWAAAFGGQVTVTLATSLALPVGSFFPAAISGIAPAGFNGEFWAEVISATSIAYYLSSNPGPYVPASSVGLLMNPLSMELDTMAQTFFSQGSSQSVYVLELGAGTVPAGVSSLRNFISTSDEQFFYSYLVPRNWDGVPEFLAFLAEFESPTAKTYFFITTTLATWTLYTAQMKDVVALIEAPSYNGWPANNLSALTWAAGKVTGATATAHGIKPGDWFNISGADKAGYNGMHQAIVGTTGTALIFNLAVNPGVATTFGQVTARTGISAGIPPGEFTLAAPFFVSLNYAPGPTNKVPPYAFSFLFGVTPFPTFGNSALIQTLKTGNINYVGTGAEGGISDLILLWGHTMDGRPFNYWYSVDWMQINVDLAISNAIINGSNTTINPLYYNQDGINRLQDVAANVGAAAISFGLAVGRVVQVGLDGAQFNDNMNRGLYTGNVVVNAVPFGPYLRALPGDYKIGKYSGFTMIYTPQRGFEQIIFNIVVTDFVATAV